jgi:hypothetical protein
MDDAVLMRELDSKADFDKSPEQDATLGCSSTRASRRNRATAQRHWFHRARPSSLRTCTAHQERFQALSALVPESASAYLEW